VWATVWGLVVWGGGGVVGVCGGVGGVEAKGTDV